MRNILITGASGYLGQTVLKRLHKDLLKGKIDGLAAMDIREVATEDQLKGVSYIQSDIRDKQLWKHLETEQTTTVIHLAAILDSQSSSREFQFEVDVLGTQNILDSMKDDCKIILPSTHVVYEGIEKVKNDKNGDYALFALTDTGYEKLALNFADIRNKLAEQRQIILSYKEYYEAE